MSEPNTELPRLDQDGRERPRFIFTYPKDPELDTLVAAFERGDYRTVSERAPNLATQSSDPAVQDAARDLLRRVQPDPLVRSFWVIAVVVFTFLVVWSYSPSP